MRRRVAGSSDAGPTVATILVRRFNGLDVKPAGGLGENRTPYTPRAVTHPPELLDEAVRLWSDLARVRNALDEDPDTTVRRAFGERPDRPKAIVGEPAAGDTSGSVDVAAAKRASPGG